MMLKNDIKTINKSKTFIIISQQPINQQQSFLASSFYFKLFLFMLQNILYLAYMQKCQQGEEHKQQRDLESKIEQNTARKEIRINREGLIRKQQAKITDLYHIGNKLGSGSYGQVYKVFHKQLGLTRALKIFRKQQQGAPNNPYQQLEILKHLDHPNVLKIYQYFETDYHWQVVTQYFPGKQLFDEIICDQGISQKKAAIIFAEICKALAYIHAHQIVHRDIKPQNIMVKKINQNQYFIKLIDWGLGSKAVTQLIRKCGTPQYCAPEVIKGSYGHQCDLWSLGVVLFVMLVGKFPFKGDNTKETLTLVLKGDYNFNGPQWNNISLQAKSVISKLLKKDPKQRITAKDCLNEPWVLKHLAKDDKQKQIQLFQTLKRIKQVHYDNKFQAVVVNYIQNYLQASEQQMLLKKQFEALDQNKDGVLSYQELKKGYEKIYGEIEAQKVVDSIFNKIDTNVSDQIQYSQFIAYGSKATHNFSFQQLKEAFRSFDQNEDGKINRKELNSLLLYERGTQSQDFDNLILQVDKDQDGTIDINEFIDNVNKIMEKTVEKQVRVGGKQIDLASKTYRQQLVANVVDQFKHKRLFHKALSSQPIKQAKAPKNEA